MPTVTLNKLAAMTLLLVTGFFVVLALNPHLVRLNLLRVVEITDIAALQGSPQSLAGNFRQEDPAILAGFVSPVAVPEPGSAPASGRAMVLFRNLVEAIARSPEKNRCWNPESPERIAAAVESARCRGFCADYAILLATLAQKAGLPARQVVMEGTDGLGRSVHVVAEFWLEDLQKWVMFDPTYFAVVTDQAGVYLSARELREALLGGHTPDLRVLQVIPGGQLADTPLLRFYRRRIGDMQYSTGIRLVTDHAESPLRRLVSVGEALMAPLGPTPMMIPRSVGRLFFTRTRYRVVDAWNPGSYGGEGWFLAFRIIAFLALASIVVLLFNRTWRPRAGRDAGGLRGNGHIPAPPPARGQKTGAARRLLLPVIALVAGLLAALLLVEGTVRIFVDTAVQPRYVIDPGYGVRANQPDVATRHYVPGDYSVAIHTNSAGMRGRRDYPLERIPGKRRTLILGDSFAFGYGVEDDQVVSAVLEELLNARQAGGAEVLNLAVSGFGQAEELVTWRARGSQYRPDAVVVFYFNNDIGNNAVSELFTLGPDNALVRTGKEYLPGSKLQERLFRIAPIRWLFEHSEAWNLIRNRLSSLVQRSQLRGQGLAQYDDATPGAVALTRALLTELVGEIRSAGARPVVVVIPDGRTMESNFPLTADEVAALGAGLVDAREFVTRGDYYKQDSHWRPDAHRRAAARLVPLVESPPGS